MFARPAPQGPPDPTLTTPTLPTSGAADGPQEYVADMRRNFEVQAEEEAEAEKRKERENEEREEREEIMDSRNEIGEVPDRASLVDRPGRRPPICLCCDQSTSA